VASAVRKIMLQIEIDAEYRPGIRSGHGAAETGVWICENFLCAVRFLQGRRATKIDTIGLVSG
jgi:hypothetical protein